VPGGDPTAIESGLSPITQADRRSLQGVLEKARTISGFGFALYVGPLPDGRGSAIAEHGALQDPASTVLVAVSPTARQLEIVVGVNVAVDLDDRACELAALSMTSSFAAGDLAAGLREGIVMLAEHARHPRVLHLDDPA